MWTGGVRVIVLNSKKEILMVKHHQDDKDIWMVPGGGIEEGETAIQAAAREVKEETHLEIEVGKLIWHVEEVSPKRGQRFVNFFLAKSIGGSPELGYDPERQEDRQVLREVCFMNRRQLQELDILYPEYLRDELWMFLEDQQEKFDAFKIRK